MSRLQRSIFIWWRRNETIRSLVSIQPRKGEWQMYKLRGTILIFVTIWIGSYVNQFIPMNSWALDPSILTEAFLFLLGLAILVMDLAGVTKKPGMAQSDKSDNS
jgi:hypothetical protein